MRLSHLQKYILLICYGEKGKFGRGRLLRFYENPSALRATPFAKGREPKSPSNSPFAKGGEIKKSLSNSPFVKGREPKRDDQINIITKSLERLIDRGYLVGYGTRTPKKWFVKEIKLTMMGRRAAKRLMGEQQILPLKNN